MEQFLGSIIGAMVTGALAKAGEIVGGDIVVNAYGSLRSAIVRKLGKSGAVQTVEDDPRSEVAKALLAEALAKSGLAADDELKGLSDALLSAVSASDENERTAIEIGNIAAGANVLVEDLIASGRIKIGDVIGGQDITISGLRAEGDPPKKT